MTDKLDRQDGYYVCSLPPGACGCPQDSRHKCMRAHWIAISPTRNGAEGAIYRSTNLGPQADEPLCDGFEEFAPPKPAPDAMREALLAKAAQDFINKVDRGEAKSTRSYAAFKAALSAPVPPADGATVARDIVTEWLGMFDPPPQIDFQQSEFLQGAIASALAIPRTGKSPAVAAEPGDQEQVFIEVCDEIGCAYDNESALIAIDNLKQRASGLASPLVRGDREAQETMAAGAIIDVMMGGKFDWRSRIDQSDFLESADWQQAVLYARAVLSLPVQPVAPRLSRDTLNRLANANASAEEIKDALAKAYAILRWKENLENLSEEMKDDCYGFAGSVQSGASEQK